MRALMLLVPVLAACTPVDPPCTPKGLPLVAVHGFLAAGDTWSPTAQRFATNGDCAERVHAFDWDTLGTATATNVARLDAYIDAVRAKTGAAKVDLAGHSAGGGLAYEYLKDATRAKKVAHYVHLASFPEDAPAGPPEAPVPTLNVWSDGDLVIKEKGDIPGATNVHLSSEDHFAVATSAESFRAIATFLDGAPPRGTDIVRNEACRLAGKALVLGSNEPVAGGTVDIYELDADTAERRGDAAAHFEVGADGSFGPFDGRAGRAYELVVRDPAAEAPVHYYPEPFTRSDDFLRLRTFPPANTLAGALLSTLHFDDDHAVLVVFESTHALLAGRDTLALDGAPLPMEAFATKERTAIAVFLDDGNQDGKSDLTPLDGLNGLPFLSGLDVFLPATPRTATVTLDGRSIRVRTGRSGSDGPVIAVFR